MTDERRKQLLLAALAVGLVVMVGRQFAGGSSSRGRVGGGSGAGEGGGDAGGLQVEVVELGLESLEREAAHFSPGRDPFRFGAAPPPPAPTPPPPDPEAAERARRAAGEAAERLRESRSAAPARPQPPPVDVVYLGSFGPRGRQLAVFTDGNDIYNAFRGGVVKEKFRVVEIGYESADLGFVGFPDVPAKRLAVGG